MGSSAASSWYARRESPFGIIHTLTADNSGHRSVGGGVRGRAWRAPAPDPSARAGRRAEALLANEIPAQGVLGRGYLLAKALEAHYGCALEIQLDALLRRDVLRSPSSCCRLAAVEQRVRSRTASGRRIVGPRNDRPSPTASLDGSRRRPAPRAAGRRLGAMVRPRVPGLPSALRGGVCGHRAELRAPGELARPARGPRPRGYHRLTLAVAASTGPPGPGVDAPPSVN